MAQTPTLLLLLANSEPTDSKRSVASLNCSLTCLSLCACKLKSSQSQNVEHLCLTLSGLFPDCEAPLCLLASSTVLLILADSEHSAIFQCIQGLPENGLRRIILTASGGAFRDWPVEKMKTIKVADALKHPNWSMGRKITVDSATLMNKGLEVIEAHYLFGIDYDNIDIVIHPQSIIHSMVETQDSSVLAQVS